MKALIIKVKCARCYNDLEASFYDDQLRVYPCSDCTADDANEIVRKIIKSKFHPEELRNG